MHHPVNVSEFVKNKYKIRQFALFSEVYCRGKLLHTVQMAKLYKDSKTFVDMKMKNKPEITLKNFNAFMEENNDKPSTDAIRKFVEVRPLHKGVRSYTYDIWKPARNAPNTRIKRFITSTG